MGGKGGLAISAPCFCFWLRRKKVRAQVKVVLRGRAAKMPAGSQKNSRTSTLKIAAPVGPYVLARMRAGRARNALQNYREWVQNGPEMCAK